MHCSARSRCLAGHCKYCSALPNSRCVYRQFYRPAVSLEVSSRIQQVTPNEIAYFKSKQGLLLSCWKDSSIVIMLSNCYESGTAETTKEEKKDK